MMRALYSDWAALLSRESCKGGTGLNESILELSLQLRAGDEHAHV
jgi:hypothetical protein